MSIQQWLLAVLFLSMAHRQAPPFFESSCQMQQRELGLHHPHGIHTFEPLTPLPWGSMQVYAQIGRNPQGSLAEGLQHLGVCQVGTPTVQASIKEVHLTQSLQTHWAVCSLTVYMVRTAGDSACLGSGCFCEQRLPS